MNRWLWYVWIYSFLGYGIEKMFAAITKAEHQVRKCLLLLPFCPVYGLGMAAVLALPDAILRNWWLILFGGAMATAVEYVVHWGYERFLGVCFWDYSHVRGNLRGRVCLPFAAAWGILCAAAVWFVHPVVNELATAIPAEVTYLLWMLFVADGVASAFFLRNTGNIDGLRLWQGGK